MKLLLTRFQATDNSTVGRLLVDGAPECYTLEDALRYPGQKIADKTAIDPGTYRVVIDASTRFRRLMPHVLDVPDFTGIRIHWGNTDADTRGCILVGHAWVPGSERITGSQVAFDQLFAKLEAAEARGEVIELEIVEQAEEDQRIAA